MPGFQKSHADVFGELHALVVMVGDEVLQRRFGFLFAVKGSDQRIVGIELAAKIFGVQLLDVRGIQEHQVAEVFRGGVRVNGSGVAVFDEQGNVAAMVDMGVRQNHAVHRFHIDKGRFVLLT